jgi:hypothetical protein
MLDSGYYWDLDEHWDDYLNQVRKVGSVHRQRDWSERVAEYFVKLKEEEEEEQEEQRNLSLEEERESGEGDGDSTILRQ